MNPNAPLRFEFFPSKDDDARRDGWGSGILYIRGTPFWYSNSEVDPQPVEWTWVDFLEHVASNWGALVYEQPYPYPWLNDAAHPGDIWSVAERRWARLGEDIAEAEEAALLTYERQHNLASAWKGLSLPALTIARAGDVCWICAEGLLPIRAPFDECRAALVSICNTLAQSFENSTNSRVLNAVNRWRDRGASSMDGFFRLVTGMSQEVLSAIQGDADPFEFWDVAANDAWVDGDVEEGPLLAAARMTAGILDSMRIRQILDAIRLVPKGRFNALNEITTTVRKSSRGHPSQFAFNGGYIAAEIVREALNRDRGIQFDIDAVLQKLGVSVHTQKLGTEKIDAVAVWGARGPCVILNEDRLHKSPERTRMTLAHELAHLVLDREGGLPFCEVLGGALDDFVERRANAFAAELLLPRAIVEQRRITSKEGIGTFVSNLKQDFSVSKSVICAQIFNSRVFVNLNSHEREFVEARLRLQDAIDSRHAIRVQSAGDVL